MKQRTQLWELYLLNQRIAINHLLKEDFTTLFECHTLQQAAHFPYHWMGYARQSGLRPLAKLAEQRERWRLQLLNYFLHRVSTGLAEAINNRINVLKRTARGCRNLEYVQIKILQRCGSRPPLPTT